MNTDVHTYTYPHTHQYTHRLTQVHIYIPTILVYTHTHTHTHYLSHIRQVSIHEHTLNKQKPYAYTCTVFPIYTCNHSNINTLRSTDTYTHELIPKNSHKHSQTLPTCTCITYTNSHIYILKYRQMHTHIQAQHLIIHKHSEWHIGT